MALDNLLDLGRRSSSRNLIVRGFQGAEAPNVVGLSRLAGPADFNLDYKNCEQECNHGR